MSKTSNEYLKSISEDYSFDSNTGIHSFRLKKTLDKETINKAMDMQSASIVCYEGLKSKLKNFKTTRT